MSEYVHVYVKGKGGDAVFYRLEDFLVFISVVFMASRQSGVKIMSICIMVNHFHLLEKAESLEAVTLFQKSIEQAFVREYNMEYSRKGSLFRKNFGRARKTTAKKVRTCVAYINNNPVVGRLSSRAVEYRWNLLAYNECGHPFSDYVPLAKCSARYRRSVSLVNYMSSSGRPLSYPFLKLVFSSLDRSERKGLTDYIIFKYNPIDYSELVRLYGSFGSALIAFDSNTGDEYDIREDWEDYSLYRSALNITMNLGFIGAGKGVDSLSHEMRMKLYRKLMCIPGMTRTIAMKFLHLKKEARNTHP